MPYEFKLPDIGEGLNEAEIVRWFVNVGDTVKPDDTIAEVQTDKAVVEMTTPVGGTISSKAGEVGTIVMVGETLITLNQANEETPALYTREYTVKQTYEETQEKKERVQEKKTLTKRIIAAPVVRKRARDLGIDLSEVTGSAKGGRITIDDLVNFKNNQTADATKKSEIPPLKNSDSVVASTGFVSSKVERIPVRGLRKKIAEKMVQSAYTAPHVSSMDEIDVSKLVQLRKQLLEHFDPRIKLTYLPFIIKSVTKALKEHPYFNSSYDDDKKEILLKRHYNIGIATATKQGLVVPVIKHTDKKSLIQIAVEIEDLVKKSHEQRLALSDIEDGTFTITSTGMGGGWFATPIINYPEVAIFGAHAIKKRPVVIDDEIVIREMMGVTITFDHRVIDGEPAARFMKTVTRFLEHPEMLLLDVK